jgi:hypothetical protein
MQTSAHVLRLPRGKHKKRDLTEVPADYLRRLVNRPNTISPDLWQAAYVELHRRRLERRMGVLDLLIALDDVGVELLSDGERVFWRRHHSTKSGMYTFGPK